MTDIERGLYSKENRKDDDSDSFYDDDICVLFYGGHKVCKSDWEHFRKYFIEESCNCEDETMKSLLDDFGIDISLYKFNKNDLKENYEDIWTNLDWNKDTKSFKYKDWELIVLDI